MYSYMNYASFKITVVLLRVCFANFRLINKLKIDNV